MIEHGLTAKEALLICHNIIMFSRTVTLCFSHISITLEKKLGPCSGSIVGKHGLRTNIRVRLFFFLFIQKFSHTYNLIHFKLFAVLPGLPGCSVRSSSILCNYKYIKVGNFNK